MALAQRAGGEEVENNRKARLPVVVDSDVDCDWW